MSEPNLIYRHRNPSAPSSTIVMKRSLTSSEVDGNFASIANELGVIDSLYVATDIDRQKKLVKIDEKMHSKYQNMLTDLDNIYSDLNDDGRLG